MINLRLFHRELSHRRDLRLIRRSPYFDQDWYLRNNKDVADRKLDPATHFLQYGGIEGRNPGPDFHCARYRRENPACVASDMNPLVHFHRFGARNGSPALGPDARQAAQQAAPATPGALPVRLVRNGRARVTIVADALAARTPFDGMATAVILGTFWAHHTNASLRIVTRREAAEQNVLPAIWAASGVEFSGDVEFVFAPANTGRYDIDVGSRDVFLTTCWQTTQSTLQSIDGSRISYLVQEDERLTCGRDEERRHCTETLADPKIGIVVKTRALYDRLSAEGHESVARNGIWFEPAVPEITAQPETPAATAEPAFQAPRTSRPRPVPHREWSGALAGVVNRLAAI